MLNNKGHDNANKKYPQSQYDGVEFSFSSLHQDFPFKEFGSEQIEIM